MWDCVRTVADASAIVHSTFGRGEDELPVEFGYFGTERLLEIASHGGHISGQ